MDYVPGSNVDLKFNTIRPSSGAPFTLAGTPVISVYKDNSTTQSTAGVTLTVDFDSVTGLHHVRIDTSADGTFYSAGSKFYAVVTTGTVDGVSAVGIKAGEFRLAQSIATQVLDDPNAIESGLTLRGATRLNTAALAGKVSGAGTGTETFRNVGDTKDRIVSTVDVDGNRTAVTTDAT